jgi:hypothetical protein
MASREPTSWLTSPHLGYVHWPIRRPHHPFFVTTSSYMSSRIPGCRSRYFPHYVSTSRDCISYFEAKGKFTHFLALTTVIHCVLPTLYFVILPQACRDPQGWLLRRFLRCLSSIKAKKVTTSIGWLSRCEWIRGVVSRCWGANAQWTSSTTELPSPLLERRCESTIELCGVVAAEVRRSSSSKRAIFVVVVVLVEFVRSCG